MSDPVTLRAAPPLLQGRRILVVEDEYMVAEDLRQGLEALGAEVLGPVPSVAQAMALLDGPAVPDAALLDVNLGGEMVFPVAEALQDRSIPFMFATGYDRCSMPAGYAGVPHCEKPFDAGACLTTLFGQEAGAVADEKAS